MNSEQPGARPSTEESTFSLEDIDKIIEQEDPQFLTEMAAVKEAGKEITADIESIDIDEDGHAKIEEVAVNKKPTRLQKIKEKVLRSIGNAKRFVHLNLVSVKGRTIEFCKRSLLFARHELPERSKYYFAKIVGAIKAANIWLVTEYKKFSALSRKAKVSILITLICILTAVIFLSKTVTGGKLPRFSNPLVRSLIAESNFVRKVKNNSDMIDLYSAFPEVEYYVLLRKVVVNLRREYDSGKSPMGAFEFYLGLDSQDTAVEAKDRELEFLDISQRTLEKFSYSEIVSEVGKIRMKSALREALNAALNQGRIHHVYFNTFVAMP